MFNAGVKGKRSQDSTGIITVGEHFNQQQYLIPTVTRFAVTDGSYVDTNDTAADTAGSQTIVLYGSGFAPGATVLVGSTTIGAVTFLDSGRLTFSSPALGSGSYTIFVTNANGGTGILVPGLVYSGLPTFTTAAGSLGSVYETTAISTSVVATGDAPITYALSSGSLPSGSSLSSGGTISGTAPVDGSSTTYSFTVQATDAQNQDSVRSFTLTITTDVVSFSSPANNTTTTATSNTAISNVTVTATSAAGYGVLYTSSGLPTGLSMNTSTGIISGTPTIVASNTSIITATANTTTRTAALYLNWTINLPGDLFWKYASLLMSANTVPNGNTFNTDLSTFNNEVVVVADTKPNKFHPFKEGYYSNYFDGTGDYLAILTSSAFNIATNSFTVEAWINTSSATQQTIFNISDTASLGYGAVRVQVLSNQTVQWLMGPGGSWGVAVTAGSITLGTWNHIAITRNGSSVYFFINGLQVGTTQTYATSLTTGGTTYIGYNSGTAFGFNGYISNLRFINGNALYTANTTPSTTPLTAIANTSLLTCQSNKLIDNSNNNFTIAKGGDTTVNPFSPFNGTPTSVTVPAANNYSMYFDGTGDYVTLTGSGGFNISTNGTYTIEAWIYVQTTAATSKTIISKDWSSGTTYGTFLFILDSTNKLLFSIGSGTTSATGAVQVTGVGTISTNTWTHVAVTVNSTNCKFFINGALDSSQTLSGTVGGSSGVIYVGASQNPGNYWNGYISNLRMVKTALYSSQFTTSTSPLTVIANTELLMAQANTVIDNGNNAYSITTFGDARPARNGPFANTTTVTLVGNEGSAYFDGTGDLLTIPNHPSHAALGTSDFTLELWFNQTVLNVRDNYLISHRVSGYAPFLFWINSLGSLRFYASSDLGTWNLANDVALSAISLNTWNHFAYTRNGSTFRVFLNGAQVYTFTSSATFTTATTALNIGGQVGGTDNFTGYVSNARFVKGTALYTTPFVPSWTPLTPVANTVLLTAQTNLSSNTKSFVDESNINSIVTGFGNANLGSFSPFGSTWSGYFDGSGDYIAMPNSSGINFGTGDFTVECWVNWSSTTIDKGIISRYTGASSGWALRYDSGGLNWINGDTSILTSTHTPVAGTWYHYAVCRSGTTFRMFINGAQTASVTYSGNQDNSSSLYIGSLTNSVWFLNGYISNVRILKGTALYTAAFTPSTTQLLPIANTTLLTCNSNKFVDYSAANNVITRTGDASVSKFSPFSPIPVTPASYSGYFDGTGDYLTTSAAFNSAMVGLAGSKWTIEAWVNIRTITALNAYYVPVIGTYQAVAANGRWWFGYDGNAASGTNARGHFTYTTGTGTQVDLIATATFGFNVWTHIAVTINATTSSSSTITIYTNGVGETFTAQNMSTQTSNYSAPNIGGNIYLNAHIGYISNLRMVKGTSVYTGNFTPPTAQLGLSQSSGTNITSLGIPANGNSVYFDGTGDYLTTAATSAFANLWFGDVTVECWVFFNSVSSTPHIWSFSESSSIRVTLYVASSVFKLYTTVITGGDIITSATTLTTGRWYHVAITKNSGTWTMWLDGVSQGTSTSTNRPYAVNEMVAIGTQNYSPGAGDYLNGYISNLRAVSNTVLYTTTFTPPTAPLTGIANTSLLTCQNSTPSNTRIIIDSSNNAFPITSFGDTIISRWSSPFGNTALLLTCQSTSFIDNSNNAFDITVAGDAKPVIQNPFTDTVGVGTSYSANTFGNSIYFDGTGDYLTAAYSPNFNIPASTPFTIEGWAYTTATTEFHFANRNWAYGSSFPTFAFFLSSGTTPSWQIGGTGVSSGTMMNAGLPGPLCQWNHYAWTRDASNVCRIFTNGVEAVSSTRTDSQALTSASGSMYVGVSSNLASNYTNGYLSGLKFIVGSCLYTSSFVPSNQPAPVTSNTVLLAASTVGPSVTDATRNHNIETFGTSRYVANNSPYYDTYSGYFDGTGDYLSVPSNAALQFGTGNFTTECWFYLQSSTSSQCLYDFRASSVSTSGFFVGIVTNGYIQVWSNANIINYNAGITIGQWYHLAIVRNSGTITAYLNGTSVVTASNSTNWSDSVCRIGSSISVGENIIGYISNLRVVKGTAVYTTTFTPPTQPLTAIANTSLLTCQSNRFIDNSTNALTITKVGDAKITTLQPFTNSNTSRSSSVYFATKTDYLAVRSQPSLTTFPGDFTFECWVYPTDTSLSTSWGIWDSRQAGATINPMIFSLTALASPVTGSWRLTYYNGTQYYGTGTVLSNQWTHVAWVRSGTTMTFYVNGVAGGTATISGTQTGNATTAPIYIGSKDNGLANYGTVGYIANLRITNGYARTITVPTAPYDIK